MSETIKRNETVQRYQVADYLNIGTNTENYEFMGMGFNTLDENPSAQQDSKTYICDKSATTTIKGYQTQFPFDTDLIKSQKAIMYLYDIGRNQKTGADAETDYVRVELFEPISGKDNTFKARKFRVAAEISSFAGAGGETIKVTGNLNNVGSFIDGEFNTVTRTFTPTGNETGGTV